MEKLLNTSEMPLGIETNPINSQSITFGDGFTASFLCSFNRMYTITTSCTVQDSMYSHDYSMSFIIDAMRSIFGALVEWLIDSWISKIRV